MSSWPAAFVDSPQKLTNMEDDEARKRRRLGEGDEGNINLQTPYIYIYIFFFSFSVPTTILSRNTPFLQTRFFSLIFAKPLYQKVRIDHRITFTFSQNSENNCKLPVRSWFLGFSLIFDFSVYFNYL